MLTIVQGHRQNFLKAFSNQNNTTPYDDSMQYCACAIACIPYMLQMSGGGGGRGAIAKGQEGADL